MSRASGKVILFGEHAVVYGVPAIAVGIDRGATATARFSDEAGASTLRVGAWGITIPGDDRETPLGRAFGDLVVASGVRGSVIVEADTDLPPGAGLGCSAALGVAVARALEPDAGTDVIVERAGVWERVFHGNPSGVDAAVATLGGCVEFVRGAPVERVRVPGAFHLCVGHSGQASSTRSMVDAVARTPRSIPTAIAGTP